MRGKNCWLLVPTTFICRYPAPGLSSNKSLAKGHREARGLGHPNLFLRKRSHHNPKLNAFAAVDNVLLEVTSQLDVGCGKRSSDDGGRR